MDSAIIDKIREFSPRTQKSPYTEEFKELNDIAIAHIFDIAKKVLTTTQYNIFHLYCEGYTQHEIAVQLNINQSSITKSLMGNRDYVYARRIQGSSAKKIKNALLKDNKFKSIIKKMYDCMNAAI